AGGRTGAEPTHSRLPVARYSQPRGAPSGRNRDCWNLPLGSQVLELSQLMGQDWGIVGRWRMVMRFDSGSSVFQPRGWLRLGCTAREISETHPCPRTCSV